MEALLPQLLNGLAFAMLLFLVASGLSVVFGLMDVLNLAHGSFYMVGAYFGLTLVGVTGSFWLALVLAPIGVALLAYPVQRWLIRPISRRGHLDQVLLTFGLALIIADGVRWIWGPTIRSIAPPPGLIDSIDLPFGYVFPAYRLFVILFGVALALVIWSLLERTRWGATIRAGVTDRTMARHLGIDIERVFAHTFAFGAALAALAGVVAAPVLSLYPGMDFEVLILALIVVVVGGLGSVAGAFWGSVLVGVANTLGVQLVPQFAMFTIFAVMALVLLYRPAGLLGRKPR